MYQSVINSVFIILFSSQDIFLLKVVEVWCILTFSIMTFENVLEYNILSIKMVNKGNFLSLNIKFFFEIHVIIFNKAPSHHHKPL